MDAVPFKSKYVVYKFFQIFCRPVSKKIWCLETVEHLREESQVGWYYINDHVLIMPQDVRKIATTRSIEHSVFVNQCTAYMEK